MELFNGYDITVDDKDKFLRIANVFTFYYEVYTNNNTSSVRFEDSTIELFHSDRFTFGRLVLQLFSVFNIAVNHSPLQEFQQFPTVADLLLYIYENTK
ncbi:MULTISPECIES: hypothetical protein [Bacillus cereus group]|uniref:hypothetical protein n=1 Tax=Bacillus cereus group TaxID=86661 RepID=UPI0022E56811|nr:hypothetical protein [Bacillus cereus group sp. TH152-1LC]MDA1674582.1 hypothetical protein [Bacillus cereus group sp. TH152-1LC]